MARQQPASSLHRLTVREVLAAGEGDHSDGGGLLLRVRAESASWVLRFTAPGSRRREMGLGPARRGSTTQAGDSVKLVRDLARGAREVIARGADPIDEREKAREAVREAELQQRAKKARERLTLARAARDYHERVIEPSRSEKHGAQWITSLQNHIPEAIWNASSDSLTAPQLLEALTRMRSLEDQSKRIPETVYRIRPRLDAIFEDAMFHGRCTFNPAAAIRRKMTEARMTRELGEFKALPYRDAPAFMTRLRAQEGIAARCLEFAVLTASRTSEALLAQWDEVDFSGRRFNVPAERMKAGAPHAAHLSDAAISVLESMRNLHKTWVFPSPRLDDRPLSNMSMLVTLDRMGDRERTTVHGLCRATFSTWANETGAARPDVIEACLAHREQYRMRASYNRAQFWDARCSLLDAWAAYLNRQESNVVTLRAA
jgi:integrase